MGEDDQIGGLERLLVKFAGGNQLVLPWQALRHLQFQQVGPALLRTPADGRADHPQVQSILMGAVHIPIDASTNPEVTEDDHLELIEDEQIDCYCGQELGNQRRID